MCPCDATTNTHLPAFFRMSAQGTAGTQSSVWSKPPVPRRTCLVHSSVDLIIVALYVPRHKYYCPATAVAMDAYFFLRHRTQIRDLYCMIRRLKFACTLCVSARGSRDVDDKSGLFFAAGAQIDVVVKSKATDDVHVSALASVCGVVYTKVVAP